MTNTLLAFCLLFLLFNYAYSHESTNAAAVLGEGDPDADVDSFKLTQQAQPEALETRADEINADAVAEEELGGGKKKKPGSDDYQTNFMGAWEIVSQNAGVSAMHLIVLPNNKAVMFDSTVLGPSQLRLADGNCRKMPNNVEDCWAHAAEFDIEKHTVRPLKVNSDTWCSSGGLNEDGLLIQAGGWNEGGRAVRTLDLCETCDWVEYMDALSGQRWYSTQQILPDGSFVVVGGRNMMNYEFIQPLGTKNAVNYELAILKETTDNIPGSENNLYPHVHLVTDGNLFIMANYKAILLDPKANRVLRQFPDLAGPRNYPGSAASAVLPIKLAKNPQNYIKTEVAICGGAPKEAYRLAETKHELGPALRTCGRIKVTDPNAKWKIETMPAPRVMADMMILPTGDLMMVNGAKLGCSGWEFADDPYLSPVLYRTTKPKDQRFVELAPSNIPRMYHSTAAVLPDGKVLVAGSSTHNGYKYVDVKFPTELRVEKFSPPYLDPQLDVHRPVITSQLTDKPLKYGAPFEVDFNLKDPVTEGDVKVTMYSPAFTTHGYSMNQRLVVLSKNGLTPGVNGGYKISVNAPPTGAVAPPGFWMLFVLNRGVPSKSIWVKMCSRI